MKKYYITSLFLLGFIAGTNAQITITKADMPKPGDTVRLSTTTNGAGLPVFALAGPNYTWDYSKLVPMSQMVDTFLSVSSTPLAYQVFFNDVFLYPNYVATVAQAGPNIPALGPVTITKVINYYRATSSAYEGVGFGANINSIPTSVKDDSIDYMYRFPMNYGDADSCNSSYHLSIPGLGYYGEKQHRVNHVDGWGTLTTPYGTFQTLRITTELFALDTIYIDTLHIGFATPQPEQIQYKWFAAGEELPLLQVNENVVANNPALTSIVYRDSARALPNAIAQVNSGTNQIKVFPNPSQNIIYVVSIITTEVAEADLYNSTGQMIMQKQLGKLLKGNAYAINISALSPGIYYLKLNSEGNSKTYKVIKD